MPVAAQLVIIVAAFALVMVIVTLLLNTLDQPSHTPPPAYGTGEIQQ